MRGFNSYEDAILISRMCLEIWRWRLHKYIWYNHGFLRQIEKMIKYSNIIVSARAHKVA